MKRTIILAAIIAATGAIAMQEGSGPCFLCTSPANDGSSDDLVYVNDGLGGRKIETYEHYYYSIAATEAEDDNAQLVSVLRPLFLQLCVQASKERALDQRPFQELLQRLKAGVINHSSPEVKMTNKDGFHRLLSYIPCGTVHALVNDKKVQLWTRAVLAERAEPAPKMEFTETGWKSYKPQSAPRFTEEKKVAADYDFEKDAGHHGRVAEAFAALIAHAE